eukprot:gene6044-8321_t
MSSEETRPPDVPKPSYSSLLAKNRLRERLVLGWKKPSHLQNQNQISYNQSDKVTNAIGIGERQFDMADNVNSSTVFETNSFLLHGEDSMMSQSLDQHQQHHYDDLVSRKSMVIPGKDSLILSQTGNTNANPMENIIQSRTSKPVASKQLQNKLSNTSGLSHLLVSKVYKKSGWDGVANSIANGETEFCYLDADESDHYKFQVKSTFPNSIRKNEYVTLSRHGLMRSTGGETELTTPDELMRDNRIYYNLQKIKLFGKYQLWKSMYMWRKYVKRRKFTIMSERLNNNHYLLDPFFSDLVLSVKACCLQLEKTVIVKLKDVTSVFEIDRFVDNQLAVQQQTSLKRSLMIQSLTAQLCKLGEENILLTAIGTAPVVVTSYIDSKIKKESKRLNYFEIKADSEGSSKSSEKYGLAKSILASMKNNDDMSDVSSIISKKDDNIVSPMVNLDSNDIMSTLKPEIKESLPYTETSQMSYTEKATIRNRCRKLKDLFRLVDFMIRDALYEATESGLSGFQSFISGESNDTHTSSLEEPIEISIENSFLEINSKLSTKSDMQILPNKNETENSWIEKSQIKFNIGRTVNAIYIVSVVLKSNPPSAANLHHFDAFNSSSFSMDLSSSIDELHETNRTSHYITQPSDSIVNAPSSIINQHRYSIAINPKQENIISKLESITTTTLMTGSYVTSVLSNEHCRKLFTPIINEIIDLPTEDRIFPNKGNSGTNNNMNINFKTEYNKKAYVDSNAVHYLKSQCFATFHNDIQSCMSFLLQYNPLCQQFERNCIIHSYHSEVTKLADITTDQLIIDLQQFNRVHAVCNNVYDYQDVGIFRLDFTEFKKKIFDSITNCKSLYFKLIPDLYIINSDRLYSDLSAITDVLSSKFTKLEEYVKLVDVFNKTTANNDKLRERFNYLSNLFEIIGTFNIPKSDATNRHNVILTNIWWKFNQLMTDFDANLEENNKIYKTELNLRNKKLLEPVQRAAEYLTCDKINNPTSESHAVLHDLSDLKQDIEVVRKKGIELESYQSILKMTIYDKDVVNAMLEELQSNYLLWSIVKSVKELEISLMSINFLDADSSEIERELSSATFTLQKKVKPNSSPQVRIWLINLLKDLQAIAPIIKKLQSPTLKETHLHQIQLLISHNIYDDSDITIGELIDKIHITDYLEQINEIYINSLYQHHIESKVNEMMKHCTTFLIFEFETEKENRNLMMISNLNTIKEYFEDMLTTIQSTIASKYSTASASVFSFCRNQIKLWMSLLESVAYIQDNYVLVRILFTSARTARYLSSCLKYFKTLDEIWRAIVKFSKHDPRVTALFNATNTSEDLGKACEAIKQILAVYHGYVKEQCVKYPKLYLFQPNELMNIFYITEPKLTFAKCSLLFPMIQELIFDDAEQFNTMGVISNTEIIEFKKPCSARNNLIDWFKAIEYSLIERLEFDIKELALEKKLLVEEIRHPRTSEQSRICHIQTTFWRDLFELIDSNSHQGVHQTTVSKQDSNVQSNNGNVSSSNVTNSTNTTNPLGVLGLLGINATNSKRRNLRPLLQQVLDQISMMSSILLTHNEPYQILSTPNLMLLYIYHRDLLGNLMQDSSFPFLNEENIDSQFIIEASLKKFSVPGTGSSSHIIIVKQGPYISNYGYHYQGFGSRLVITPFTDKCYLSINLSLRQSAIPVVHGMDGVGKRTLLSSLTYELGVESFNIDCLVIKQKTDIIRIMKALVGSRLWLNVLNINHLTSDLLAMLLSSFSSIQNAISLNNYDLDINGENISETVQHGASNIASGFHNSIQNPPRICIIINSSFAFGDFEFLFPSVRNQFRPLLIQQPARLSIISSLLASHNISQSSQISVKLNNICNYLVAHNIAEEQNILRTITTSLRGTCKALHATLLSNLQADTSLAAVSESKQLKEFATNFLSTLNKKLNESEIKIINDIYMEENCVVDPKSLKPTFIADQFNYHMHNTELGVENGFISSALPTSIISSKEKNNFSDLSRDMTNYLLDIQVRCVFVVGDINTGKTTLINQSIDTAIQLHNRKVDKILDPTALQQPVLHRVGSKLSISSASTSNTNNQHLLNEVAYDPTSAPTSAIIKMEKYPRKINPFAMSDYNPIINAVYHGSDYELMHTILHEDLVKSAKHVVDQTIQKLKPMGLCQIMHVDAHSSIQTAHLAPYLTAVSKDLQRRAKFVIENVELNDVDPALIASTPIIYIKKSLFGIDDMIDAGIERVCASESTSFRNLLVQCVNDFIRPCLGFIQLQKVKARNMEQHLMTRKHQQQRIFLIENLFKMIHSFITTNDVTNTSTSSHANNSTKIAKNAASTVLSSSVKWNEDSIIRITIFCCIWTIGASPSMSRTRFDSWFKEYFESMNENMKDKRLFPTTVVNTSIFDFFLYRQDESDMALEWISHSQAIGMETLAANVLNISSLRSTSLDDSINRSSSIYRNQAQGMKSSVKNEPININSSSSWKLTYTASIMKGSKEGKSSILIPTSTGRAYSAIQSALLSTNYANVCITGPRGSGKSSIMSELYASMIHVSDKSVDYDSVSSRWICLLSSSDCSPIATFSHLMNCKHNMNPKLIERKLNDYGVIFLEDLNTNNKVDNHYTCEEYLRDIYESHHYYNFDNGSFKSIKKLYTLISSNDEVKHSYPSTSNGSFIVPLTSTNNRFIRHHHLLHCDYDDLTSIFLQKLRSSTISIKEDIAEDITNMTVCLFNKLEKLLVSNFGGNADNCSTLSPDLILTSSPGQFSSREEQLFILNSCAFTKSRTVNYILSKLTSSINSVTVFTSNDVIRMWDRIISDYSYKYPKLDNIINLAHEQASVEYEYKYPSFGSIAIREKSIRLSTREQLNAITDTDGKGVATPRKPPSTPNNSSRSSPLRNVASTASSPLNVYENDDVISYTKNANGYFRITPGAYHGISTAELFRGDFMKACSNLLSLGANSVDNMDVNNFHELEEIFYELDLNSLSLWTDLQTCVSYLTLKDMSYNSNSITNNNYLFLTGNSPYILSKLIRLSSFYINHQYEHIHLLDYVTSNSSFKRSEHRPNATGYVSTQNPAFVPYALLVNHYESYLRFNKFQNFYYQLTELFFRYFITDPIVLQQLRELKKKLFDLKAASIIASTSNTAAATNAIIAMMKGNKNYLLPDMTNQSTTAATNATGTNDNKSSDVTEYLRMYLIKSHLELVLEVESLMIMEVIPTISSRSFGNSIDGISSTITAGLSLDFPNSRAASRGNVTTPLQSRKGARSTTPPRPVRLIHITVPSEFNDIPHAWDFLHKTMELRSDLISLLLLSISLDFDPRSSIEIRNIIDEFRNQLKFVFTFQSESYIPNTMSNINTNQVTSNSKVYPYTSTNEIAMINQTLCLLHKSNPQFVSSIVTYNAYHNYVTLKPEMISLFGMTKTNAIYKLIEQILMITKNRLYKNESKIIPLIDNQVYFNATLDMICYLYKFITSLGDKWSEYMLMVCGTLSLRNIITKIKSNYDNYAIQKKVNSKFDILNLTGKTISEQFRRSSTFQSFFEKARAAEMAKIADEANMKESSPMKPSEVNLQILGDILFNTIYSRYVLIGNKYSNRMELNNLFSEIKKAQFLTSKPDDLPLYLLPTATATTLHHFTDEKCASYASSKSLLCIARTLPESSSLQQLFSGMALLLLCDQNLMIVDKSALSSHILNELLITNPLSHLSNATMIATHFSISLGFPVVELAEKKSPDFDGKCSHTGYRYDSLTPLVIPSHSSIPTELFLLYTLQRNLLVDISPLFTKSYQQVVILVNRIMNPVKKIPALIKNEKGDNEIDELGSSKHAPSDQDLDFDQVEEAVSKIDVDEGMIFAADFELSRYLDECSSHVEKLSKPIMILVELLVGLHSLSSSTSSNHRQPILTSSTGGLVLKTILNDFFISLNEYFIKKLPLYRDLLVAKSSTLITNNAKVTIDMLFSCAINDLLNSTRVILKQSASGAEDESEYYQLMMQIFFRFAYDFQSNKEDQLALGKILNFLRSVRFDRLGFAPVEKEKKSRLEQIDEEDEDEELDSSDDESDNIVDYKLSDASRMLFKQLFSMINQNVASMNPQTLFGSIQSHRNDEQVHNNSTTTNIILTSIESHIDQWILWSMNIIPPITTNDTSKKRPDLSYITSFPTIQNYSLNWLEKFIIVFILKPNTLLDFLLQGIKSIGLNIALIDDEYSRKSVLIANESPDQEVLPVSNLSMIGDAVSDIIISNRLYDYKSQKSMIPHMNAYGVHFFCPSKSVAKWNSTDNIIDYLNNFHVIRFNFDHNNHNNHNTNNPNNNIKEKMKILLDNNVDDDDKDNMSDNKSDRRPSDGSEYHRSITNSSDRRYSNDNNNNNNNNNQTNASSNVIHLVSLNSIAEDGLLIINRKSHSSDSTNTKQKVIIETIQNTIIKENIVNATKDNNEAYENESMKLKVHFSLTDSMKVPKPSDYLYAIQYYYEMIKNLPIYDEDSAGLVSRMRWLLLLFHISVQFKLSVRRNGSSHMNISSDMLVNAANLVAILCCNGQQDALNNPTHHLNSTQSRHNISPAIIAYLKRSSFQPMAMVEYVVHCIYCHVVHSETIRLIIEATFISYFTMDSFNMDIDYIVSPASVTAAGANSSNISSRRGSKEYNIRKNSKHANDHISNEFDLSSIHSNNDNSTSIDHILLPSSFEEADFIHFHSMLQKLLLADPNFLIDLLCTTSPFMSGRTLTYLHNSIDNMLFSFQNNYNNNNNNHHLSIMGSTHALYGGMDVLTEIMENLPKIIDMKSQEVIESMVTHMSQALLAQSTNITNDTTNNNNHKSKTNKLFENNNRNNNNYNNGGYRECDPLWSFVLSECNEFNATVQALRKQLEELLHPNNNNQIGIFDIKLFLNNHNIKLTNNQLLNQIQSICDHLIPPHWTYPSYGNNDNIDNKNKYYHNNNTYNNNKTYIKLDEFMSQLKERHLMLITWIQHNHPSVIKLHLLSNPNGFFHALKDTFASRSYVALEKVFINVELVDLNSSNNINTIDPSMIAELNCGCTTIAVNVHIYNAIISKRNGNLEFLPPYCNSTLGQRVALQISATLQPPQQHDEDYYCPLYVLPDMPSQSLSLFDGSNGTSQTILNKNHSLGCFNDKDNILCYVPIPTTEDTEDCRMFGIALYSSPKWRLP